MATAIVIGLGSTGLHIVEQLQQFHYQFTDNNKSNKVEYLFCETDLRVVANGTAGGNDIISVPLPLTNMAAHIPALKQQKISNQWIPPVNIALATGDGAGGQSAYGRLALWMNWNNVNQAINQAWIRVNGNNQTNIFIVGSLTGGTCTGAFIDVAYLARHITGSNKIYGMFLIPGNNHIGIAGGNNILENYLIANATLKELSKSDGSIVYNYTWPGGFQCEKAVAPYEQTYLLSTDYANNNANIGDINDLCKVAALNLCCRVMNMVDQSGNLLQNFQDMYDASIMNAKNNFGGMYKFSTFGTTLIHYPKSQLTEWFGLDLCKEMLNKFVDTKNYVDKNNVQQSVLGHRNRINSDFNKEFEEKLLESLNDIDGMPTIGASTMKQAIAYDVEKIKSEKNLKNIIFNLFISTKNDNHFGFVSNNVQIIKNTLIDKIYQLVENYMETYQNLFVIKNIFDSNGNNQVTLQSYIQRILTFWEREYQIDGNAANFNRCLQKHIDEIERNMTLPIVVFQKENYLNEQLTNLYMLCKLHFAVDILKQITKAINATQADNIVLRGNNHTLPTLSQIDALIVKVQAVVQLPQGALGRDINSRMSELDSEMTTSTHFKALFNENRESDKQQIRNLYQNLPVNEKFGSNNLCRKQIFAYLIKNNNNREQIYKDCVVQGVQYVRNQKLVGIVGISGLLQNLSQRNPADTQYVAIQHFFDQTELNIVPKHIPGLIGIRNNAQPAVQFQSHNGIKLLYTTANIVNLQNAIINRPDTAYIGQLAPANQNCVDMFSLDNALVVYQEYGFMINDQVFNPLTDVAINTPIKQIVNTIPEENHQARCPYINRKTLNAQLNLIP